MPDENKQDVNGNPVPNDAGQDTNAQDDLFTKDDVTRLIQREVAKVIAKRPDPDEHEALKKRLAEYEQAQLSEHEKLQAQIKTLETEREQAKAEAESARLEALRRQVALEKGLPAPLAGRLTGTTQEELEADADALVELMQLQQTPQPRKGSTDASAGTRQQSTGGLTEEERQYAARYGLTEEQFVKYRQQQRKGTNING